MKTRNEYGHVTFPLSLTQEEKDQYAEFCKSKDQTMSGRIKELMRQDMGFNVLSSFNEHYQLNIINKLKNNKRTVIVKSRQMWISTLLLSFALDSMLAHKGKLPYSCLFISPNANNAKFHHAKFLEVCATNGIKIASAGNDMRIELPNGSSIRFAAQARGMSAYLTILDEFAFNKMEFDEFKSLTAASNKLVVSSTPSKGSLFNSIAKEAVLGKNEFDFAVAHWMMNSIHSHNASVLPFREEDGTVRFQLRNGDAQRVINNSYTYLQEMECVLY